MSDGLPQRVTKRLKQAVVRSNPPLGSCPIAGGQGLAEVRWHVAHPQVMDHIILRHPMM